MLDYKDIIEKSKAFNVVRLDASEDRVSHAYLFLSQDENYLSSFSKKISSMLINLNEVENIEKNIIRIEKNIHPDVKVFGQNGIQINSETISDIFDLAQVCPFESDKKIFVIFDIQNMSEICQNKILKTIEEPPKNTYFLLCATGEAGILTTILSRVKKVELDAVLANQISILLQNGGVKKEDADIFAICSNGNSTFAEKLAVEDGFIEFFNDIVSCFFEIRGSKDVLKFSSKFTEKSVDKNAFFDISMVILRDIEVIIAKKSELVICKSILPKLKVIASSLNLSFSAILISKCVESKKDLVFNANQTAVIDNFLFKLAEVKIKCRRLLA